MVLDLSLFWKQFVLCTLWQQRWMWKKSHSLLKKCSVCQFLKLSPWFCSYLSFSTLQLNACVDLLGRLQPPSTSGSVLPVVYVSNDSSCRPAMSEPHLFRLRLSLHWLTALLKFSCSQEFPCWPHSLASLIQLNSGAPRCDKVHMNAINKDEAIYLRE